MEEEVKVVTIHADKTERFRVSVPKREVIEALGITRGQKVRVLVDKELGRIIYELIR